MRTGFSTPEIEQALISALIQWPEKGFPQVEANKMGEHSFSFPSHRVMFRAAHALWSKGKPIDRILFIQYLRDHNLFNQAGKEMYVNETWFETCHAPEMVPYYIELMLDRELRKGLAGVCNETLQNTGTGREATEILAEHQQILADLPKPVTPLDDWAALVDSLFDDSRSEAVPTGITRLDAQSPMRNCNMPLIAGERKAGKTALAVTIALNVANRGLPVLYITLEETRHDIASKLLSGLAHSKDPLKLIRASALFKELPIDILEGLVTLQEIAGTLHDLKQRKGIRLAIVDYAQLVRVERENREQQVAEVSRTIKNTAQQLHIPIILLCQLNEEGKTRESRALEQDCSAMWRVDPVKDKPNERLITIPFQRNGPSGVYFKVTFFGELARMENYHPDQLVA